MVDNDIIRVLLVVTNESFPALLACNGLNFMNFLKIELNAMKNKIKNFIMEKHHLIAIVVTLVNTLAALVGRQVSRLRCSQIVLECFVHFEFWDRGPKCVKVRFLSAPP